MIRHIRGHSNVHASKLHIAHVKLFTLYSSVPNISTGTFINLKDKFPPARSYFPPVHLGFKKQLQYLFKTASFWYQLEYKNHGLQTPGEDIAFTARPKIKSQSQNF